MAMCRGMCTHATWATFTSMSPGPPHEWFMVGVVEIYIIWPMQCIGDMCMAGRHHMCIGDDHGWPPPLGIRPLIMAWLCRSMLRML